MEYERDWLTIAQAAIAIEGEDAFPGETPSTLAERLKQGYKQGTVIYNEGEDHLDFRILSLPKKKGRRVTWSLDVDDIGDGPKADRQAAQVALHIMRDPSSTAVVFEVMNNDGDIVQIDLLHT